MIEWRKRRFKIPGLDHRLDHPAAGPVDDMHFRRGQNTAADASPDGLSTAALTFRSTRVILDAFGWAGTVVRSSDLHARTDRSARLADLTREAGADTYICGTGGARYLEPAAFDALGVNVDYFGQPAWVDPGIWETGKSLSATWALARYGRLARTASAKRLSSIMTAAS